MTLLFQNRFDLSMAQTFETAITITEPSAQIYFGVIAVYNTIKDRTHLDLQKLDLSLYLRNPVILYQHWDDKVIARTHRLYRFPKGELVAEFQFLQGDTFSKEVENAWSKGFIRGASLGCEISDEAHPRLWEWSIVTFPFDEGAITIGVESQEIANEILFEE